MFALPAPGIVASAQRGPDGPVFTHPGQTVREPHAHWRLRTPRAAQLSQYPSVARFGLRDTIGGTDRLLGSAGVTFSSQFDAAGNAAVNAFDGSHTLQWSPAIRSGDNWIAKQVAAAIPAAQLLIGFRASGSVQTSPWAKNLEYSDNGTDWFNIASIEDRVYANGDLDIHDLTPSPNQASAVWRVLLQAPRDGGSELVVEEIEMAATLGGADQCNGGTPSHSQAFDDNAATSSSTGSVNFHARQYNFPAPVRVKELRVTASDGPAVPRSLFLQFPHPTDSLVWLTAAGLIDQTWSGQQTKVIVNAYA